MSVTLTTKKRDEVVLLTKEIDYQFDHDVCKKFSDQQKWTLHNYVHCENHASYDIEVFDSTEDLYGENKKKSPKISATCYATRHPQYYFWNAFFLIFIITIMSFSVFSIDYKMAQTRLQGVFTLVLTSISFRWVVNRSLPTVSYLTSLDAYAIANIVLLCLKAFAHASLNVLFENPEQAKLANLLYFTIFFAIFIIINILLFIWAAIAYIKMRNLRKKIHNTIHELKSLKIRI